MAVTQTHLDEAEAAYHALLTGKAVTRFRDQNGESVEYTQASRGQLAIYIEALKRQLGQLNVGLGPMEPWF
jgi:hypothetical protein